MRESMDVIDDYQMFWLSSIAVGCLIGLLIWKAFA